MLLQIERRKSYGVLEVTSLVLLDPKIFNDFILIVPSSFNAIYELNNDKGC